ncbi:hypothetical protein TNCV_2950571 [Trichonephila clavipes]|nr:hypothetical protein TNCV_2950571 [Trichonephila clavipes]
MVNIHLILEAQRATSRERERERENPLLQCNVNASANNRVQKAEVAKVVVSEKTSLVPIKMWNILTCDNPQPGVSSLHPRGLDL